MDDLAGLRTNRESPVARGAALGEWRDHEPERFVIAPRANWHLMRERLQFRHDCIEIVRACFVAILLRE
jgi:hypothetical protein